MWENRGGQFRSVLFLDQANHAPGGIDYQNADGQSARHGQGMQALGDESAGVALNAVFHRVIDARAGYHGDNADEEGREQVRRQQEEDTTGEEINITSVQKKPAYRKF